jgi:branched-chain amino acid transport system ATP-binding protein
MSNPRLLLLDEVSLGLAPVVIADIYAALPRIAEMGTTVLIVEQDLSQVLRAADRVQCLLEGRTVLEAPAAEVTREQVAAAYFGLDREAS